MNPYFENINIIDKVPYSKKQRHSLIGLSNESKMHRSVYANLSANLQQNLKQQKNKSFYKLEAILPQKEKNELEKKPFLVRKL